MFVYRRQQDLFPKRAGSVKLSADSLSGRSRHEPGSTQTVPDRVRRVAGVLTGQTREKSGVEILIVPKEVGWRHEKDGDFTGGDAFLEVSVV